MTDEQMTAVEVCIMEVTSPMLKKAATGAELTADDWRTFIDSLFEIEDRFTLAIIDNQFKPHAVAVPWKPTFSNKGETDSFTEGARHQLSHMKKLAFRKVAWPLLSAAKGESEG